MKQKEKLKKLFHLFELTFTEWNDDKASRLAAALAYYTAISLAPLLVIVLALAGAILEYMSARPR